MEFQFIKTYTHMNAEYLKVLIDEYVINRPFVTIYFEDSNDGCVVDQLNIECIKTKEVNNVEYFFVEEKDTFDMYIFRMEDFSLLDFNDNGYLVLHVGDDFELSNHKAEEEYDQE